MRHTQNVDDPFISGLEENEQILDQQSESSDSKFVF